MKILHIPRDPRFERITFLKGIPDSLVNKIDKDIWNETIEEINMVIANASKLDSYAVLCNLFIIPLFFMKNDKLDKNLFKYLSYRNSLLMKYKIFICHPRVGNYSELKIIFDS